MGKHRGKGILPKVLDLKRKDISHRMAAQGLGYSREQVKQLIKRYHKTR